MRPDGGIVSDEQWQAFLAEEVTPRFPRGFTVLEAAGQYQDARTRDVTQERTEILLIVHTDDPAPRAAIDAIVAAYARRFAQRSVLRVEARVTATF